MRCSLSLRASKPPRRAPGPSPSSVLPPAARRGPRPGRVGPTPRRRPGHRRRAAGPGRRSRRARRASSARRPARSSPPSRRPSSPGAPSSPCRCRCASGSIEEFVEQTRTRIANADTGLVVVDPDLAPFLDPPSADAPVVLLDELARRGRAHGAGRVDAIRPTIPSGWRSSSSPSGSTASPKGVMLPDRCVGANIDAIVAGAQITHADRAVSWLPLYHDMGLIGLLMTPMLQGFELVLGAPQDFLAAPSSWLEWISEYRGTITAGPNFSYALAARGIARRAGALDLSSWRLALNGAETVDPGAVEAFCAAAAPFGFDAARRVPRVRHGRSDARCDVPRGRRGDDRRRRRSSRARSTTGWRAPRPDADPTRACAGSRSSAARCPASSLRIVDPPHRRGARGPRGRRARAAQPVGDARLLPQPGGDRGHLPRRVAAHRATSPTSSTAGSWCAVD